jgi:4-hydroxy-tetrahydrodipicolinate synthase
MEGTGVPLVTPFDETGAVDHDRLREVASWVVDMGVDFVVPCGSNGESELMTVEERAAVVETVADEVSAPVLAGTGHPGFEETREQTRLAAQAGADGALVVTPFYYNHSQADFATYYDRLADESDLPIYLYSVPSKTGAHLDPETVGTLAAHENVAGMKDSAGDIARFQRERRNAGSDFDLLIGSGSVYAAGLDAGADGGILALANVVPDLASEIHDRYRDGDRQGARDLNSDLIALNRAITARYGVPAAKEVMRYRGAPAGHVRSPHTPVDPDTRDEMQGLIDDALDR